MNQPKRAVVLGLAVLLTTQVTAAAVSGGGSQGWSRTPQHYADSGGGLPPGGLTLADSGGGMPGKP